MNALNNEIIPDHAVSRVALFEIQMGIHYLSNEFCLDGAVLYECKAYDWRTDSEVKIIEYWRNNLYYTRWHRLESETGSQFIERVMAMFGYNLNYETDMQHIYRAF